MDFVDELLLEYNPIIQSIFRGVRRTITGALPDAVEVYLPEAKAIGYSANGTDCLITVTPTRKCVRVDVPPVPRVPDPQLLLESVGKQASFVKVDSMVVATSPALMELFQEIWAKSAG